MRINIYEDEEKSNMTDYDLALKKPFTNFKKLIIGILLSILPIVKWFSFGYILECSGLGKNKTNKLPEWKNWGDLFVKGFFATIIKIIYSIPALLVFFIFGAGAFFALIKTLISTGILQALASGTSTTTTPAIQQNLSMLMPYILELIPILIITGILAILASYVSPIAILNYLKNNKLEFAFKKIVFKKAFTGKYFIVWLLVAIITGIISWILYYIPIIGPAITFFVMGIFSYTLFGQVYLELETTSTSVKVQRRK